MSKSKSESPTEWAFKTRTGSVHNSAIGWTCKAGKCGGQKAVAEKGAIRVVPCHCKKAVKEQELGGGEEMSIPNECSVA